MLTAEQQKWIDHLSETNIISVLPFDPTSEEKFLSVKAAINKVLGSQQEVVHSGASSLGISGQDEIDMYVPVAPADFDEVVGRLKSLYGEPKSIYPLVRVHFMTAVQNKRVDVFVINKYDSGWIESVKFMTHLRANPEALERYRRLKENNAGLTTREYYRRKTEFINEILAKI